MIAFITSSPCIDGADRAILNPANGFLDALREALPENPRCLFIASSPDRRDLTCRFGADMFIAFAEAGIPFSAYNVLDLHNAEEAADLIYSSDFIILAGGHVPTQYDFFREIGLDVLLAEYEGVVMGISAGSMNSAREVYIQPEEPGEALDEDFVRFAPGLGLTSASICPHYQKVKDTILDGMRLFEDITYPDSEGRTFFCLPDGSYILCDEDGEMLFGEAYRLRNGILELICVEGESIDLALLK
jgi:dipeptidase E